MKYYLIGIKGTGMSSLACLLKGLGHKVSGSDVSDYYFTEDMLIKKKIPYVTFDSKNIDGSDIYIIGNAFHEENCEVQEVIKNDYEYYYYHQFIGEILDKSIIAISGTHGKTTVTSLLAQMLKNEFSYISGDGTGYGTNDSNYLILEACEYQKHFLAYHPQILLINNIELDHPDYYQNNAQIVDAFQQFANQSHTIVINADDNNCQKIKHENKITFGFSPNSDYQIQIMEEYHDGYLIKITDDFDNNQNSTLLNNFYYLPFLGKHMIYNCVAGIVICLLLNHIPKLTNLELPKRRMATYQLGQTVIIDDYAHHPTEIKCLYETLRKTYPHKAIKVIFQPHTYTRTFKFKKQFIESLDLFDDVYIEKVFTSKREKYNYQYEKQIEAIFKKYHHFDETLITKINPQEGSVWVFLGAGVVDKYIKKIIKIDKK